MVEALSYRSPRSILFVPADRPDLASKAPRSRCDAICVDLEDSIVGAKKASARTELPRIFEKFSTFNGPVYVRVNSELETCIDDVRALPLRTDGIVLPKTRGLEHLTLVAGSLVRLWKDKTKAPRIIAMIESSDGLRSIENSTDRVHALVDAIVLGGVDLSTDLGCDVESELMESSFLRLAQLARNLQLELYGYPGSIANLDDEESFRTNTLFAARNGSVGGFCIHPRQVGIANASFAVTHEELALAERILNSYRQACDNGTGVTVVDGHMVDQPVAARAKSLLRRCGAPEAPNE